MLIIRLTFDQEFGPGGMDPLGKLVISDEHSQIVIDTTYLDSWLAALIDALHRLRTINHVAVETEEPKPMEIDRAVDGGLAFSFKDQRANAKNLKEFDLALRGAVASFLDGLKDTQDASQNRLIDPIRRFWATTEN